MSIYLKDDLTDEYSIRLRDATVFENNPCFSSRAEFALIRSIELLVTCVPILAIIVSTLFIAHIWFIQESALYAVHPLLNQLSSIITSPTILIAFVGFYITVYWNLSTVNGSKWQFLVKIVYDIYQKRDVIDRELFTISKKIATRVSYFEEINTDELIQKEACESARDANYRMELTLCVDILLLGMWNDPAIRRFFYINIEWCLIEIFGELKVFKGEMTYETLAASFMLGINDFSHEKRDLYLILKSSQEILDEKSKYSGIMTERRYLDKITREQTIGKFRSCSQYSQNNVLP